MVIMVTAVDSRKHRKHHHSNFPMMRRFSCRGRPRKSNCRNWSNWQEEWKSGTNQLRIRAHLYVECRITIFHPRKLMIKHWPTISLLSKEVISQLPWTLRNLAWTFHWSLWDLDQEKTSRISMTLFNRRKRCSWLSSHKMLYRTALRILILKVEGRLKLSRTLINN